LILAAGRRVTEHAQRIDSKTPAATRTINLTSESCVILGRRMAENSPWVFPPRRKVWHRRRREFYWVIIGDRHLTYSGIVNAHEKASSQSGVGFRIYSLRHTFATRVYRATKDIESLRRVLGHADLKTLLRYVHIDKDDLRTAMETFERSRSKALQGQVVRLSTETVPESIPDLSRNGCPNLSIMVVWCRLLSRRWDKVTY
jgi:integrase